MDTDDELHALLQQLGVRVAYADLPDDRDGEYCAADRLIRLRPNMPRRLHRSVLAHECAHALRGDAALPAGVAAERQERRADEWAARRLIERASYIRAEQLHGGHVQAIALELEVTVDLVDTYRQLLARGAVDSRSGPRHPSRHHRPSTIGA